LDRAYSLLEIKSIDDDERVIEGIASTPTADRRGDIMEPKGAQFALPMPFLWQHNQQQPIGEVFEAQVTPKGIRIKARIARIDEPGVLKNRLDEAWQSIKTKLVRGLSIGFKPLEAAVIEKTGGLHVLQWVWAELSAVTIPQNVEATILRVKELDLAASGPHLPGVTGLPVVRALKGANAMTIAEQITQFENTRAAKVAAMNEIQNKAVAEGRSKDQSEKETFDTLSLEIKSVDAELVDLREMEKINLTAATPITRTTNFATAAELRGGNVPMIQVKSMLPPATAFTRYIQAIAVGKGDYMRTLEHAKQWNSSTPEVELMVKAAVAAGNTTDATWAGPLAAVTPSVSEFLELLRPRTLIGRIPGLRKVPFNTSVNSQTGGGTYQWVGQGAAKPVTSAAFAPVTLTFAKAAGIIVLTEELVKLSNPSAEATVREEMIAGISQFLDGQFVDPAVAAVANVSPASITNGAGAAAASGVTGAAARTDLAAAIATFAAANIGLEGLVFLMNDSNAFGLGMAVNALGQPLFPGISMDGGTLMGRPVIVSNAVGNRIVIVHAPSILYADDGGVSVDVSREASVQMDSAPDSPAVATTVLVSLWQNNLVGLRAERFITWLRARTAAVRVITTAAYTGA
jgi:HK97 family phage major capsid protein/HK97 family phage prohead protease